MAVTQYHSHPRTYEAQTHIISHHQDEKGHYIILDKTLFYPQGGGQPADQGTIQVMDSHYTIVDVRNTQGEIRHYISHNSERQEKRVGQGHMTIDAERRKLNSRYHSAGHLIAAIIDESNYPLRAIKGHQFPNEAFVEFTGVTEDPNGLISFIKQAISNNIAANAAVSTTELSISQAKIFAEQLPYNLPIDKPLRVCNINGFMPAPCGGTHVHRLNEIGNVDIHKCKSKKNKTKVYYEISK